MFYLVAHQQQKPSPGAEFQKEFKKFKFKFKLNRFSSLHAPRDINQTNRIEMIFESKSENCTENRKTNPKNRKFKLINSILNQNQIKIGSNHIKAYQIKSNQIRGTLDGPSAGLFVISLWASNQQPTILVTVAETRLPAPSWPKEAREICQRNASGGATRKRSR